MERVLIINTAKDEFTNEKTGELVAYSKTTIGRKVEQSDKFSGYLIEELTGNVKDFDVIKKYVTKEVSVNLVYKKVDRKNYRAKLEKIEDVNL